jgi:5'-nucleotidase
MRPSSTQRRLIALLSSIAMVASLAVPAVSAAKPKPPVEVQILALNDFHGQLRPPNATSSGGRIGATPAGGVEYLATQVRTLRATNKNTLFVSAGDLIGATPLISAIFHDEPTIEAFNAMRLDYNGVGNHEFDEGIPELLRMQYGKHNGRGYKPARKDGCHPVDKCGDGTGFGGAKFDFLAANVTYKAGKRAGDTIFAPYRIHEFQRGVKVAIVGMTLEGTPSVVTQSAIAPVDFHDEADTVNALIPRFKRAGIETVIVLLHEGGSTGQALNETTLNTCGTPTGPIVDVVQRMDREIDLVVTGHTNWGINCPDFAGTGIMVTGAASVGRVVTDVDLTIDAKTKDVTAASINNVIVKRDLAPAPDMTALIDKYGTIAAPIETQVIGTATAAMTRTAVASGESQLGQIIADAQLAATDDPGYPGGPAVLALMNAGGIRADINAGEITFGEAFDVQPFGNILVTMDMTGQDILDTLQQQFTGGGNGILQVSRSLTYTRTAAGATGQAEDLLSNVRINGVAIDPALTYRVTVNNFLADGGDNYTELRNGTNRNQGNIDLDEFVNYIKASGTITPPDLSVAANQRITYVP